MNLRVKQEPDGTWLVQGDSSCDWCRPPEWPLEPGAVVGYCGCMASKPFKRALRDKAIELMRGKPEGPPNTEHKGTDHPRRDRRERAGVSRGFDKRKKDE